MVNYSSILKAFAFALCLTFSIGAQAQLTPLAGAKICLDPGHGGHDSDDRATELGIGKTYYESDGVWGVIGYLDTMLVKLGADTKITKTTNDPDSPVRDPSLSDRVQVGNAFGADYFHSFHTNGSDNEAANYTLVLYAGPADGNADDPDALAMAEIMADELFVYMRTTNTIARADIPFTGFTNGLGVLNNLNMPGTLSECSFHSNINEGRRLMSESYRKAAAWACVKSFLKYYEKPMLPYGEIGGVVTDKDGKALNGITVTLNPGTENEQVFTGDEYLNGYYLFDWLPAGEYEVKFEKFGFDPQQKTVTVTDGGYSEIDATLSEVGGAPTLPVLKYVAPAGTDGVKAAWLPNSELTLLGYRLYYATDDTMENWALVADENTLTKETTEITIDSKANFKVVPEKDVYHFNLTAVAESGAESESGFAFSRSSSASGDKVLIVDGFDRRSGSFTETFHTFSADYFNAIRETRIAEVTTTLNEYILDETLDLANYDLVVWYLGDESTVEETFNEDEQALLKTYLVGGGKLFVSGSEVAWDLGSRGSVDDKDFLNKYMKAQFVGDGKEEYTPATGVEGTVFEGLEIPFGITYPEDFPDDVSPSAGAISIFDYSVENTHGGVAYRGKFGGGTIDGGVVYITFPLETADQFEQKLVMNAVFKYLTVGVEKSIAPITNDDLAFASSQDAILIDVLANDQDINGDLKASTLMMQTDPANGSATITDGKIAYKANSSFGGVETFTYTVADEAGNISNAATVIVNVVNVLGSNSDLLSEMKLFPNPASSQAFLEATVSSSVKLEWTIYNSEGRKVGADQQQLPKGKNKVDLKTELLAKGIYFIQVKQGASTTNFKLVKK